MTTELQATTGPTLVPKEEITLNATSLREEMKQLEKKVRQFIEKVKLGAKLGSTGECIAQSIISLRDLENSRMRLGKVIQYAEDGVSIYDKQKV